MGGALCGREGGRLAETLMVSLAGRALAGVPVPFAEDTSGAASGGGGHWRVDKSSGTMWPVSGRLPGRDKGLAPPPADLVQKGACPRPPRLPLADNFSSLPMENFVLHSPATSSSQSLQETAG